MFRQIGTLKKSDGFSSADPPIAIQIRFPEIRLELIQIRPRRRRHLRLIFATENKFEPQITRKKKDKQKNQKFGK